MKEISKSMKRLIAPDTRLTVIQIPYVVETNVFMASRRVLVVTVRRTLIVLQGKHAVIISGIVFSSIIFVGFIVVIVVICCRRRRRPVTNQTQIVAGATSHPTYYPPLQGQPYYQLPPPQYGAIHPPPYEVRVVDSEVPNGVSGTNSAKKI
ncbi:hypothetical protein AC249_AIPGENE4275 [Exaiptasia diaphana]|nr:hypothetical protein AC249_AIPGENE4275 [Exaiptasia diaphana]